MGRILGTKFANVFLILFKLSIIIKNYFYHVDKSDNIKELWQYDPQNKSTNQQNISPLVIFYEFINFSHLE